MIYREMNEYRYCAAAAVVDEKIFCCGGYSRTNCLNSAECYDPSSNIWTLICHMPRPIKEFGAVGMDKDLILVGGSNGETSEMLNNVWALNTTDKNAKWIEKPSMFMPRTSFCITKIDDKVFVCGGFSEHGTINDVQIFDGKVWRNGPKPRSSGTSTLITVISRSFANDLIKYDTTFSKVLNGLVILYKVYLLC